MKKKALIISCILLCFISNHSNVQSTTDYFPMPSTKTNIISSTNQEQIFTLYFPDLVAIRILQALRIYYFNRKLLDMQLMNLGWKRYCFPAFLFYKK